MEYTTRIEEYKTEVIEKETIIERMRLLVANNDQELDRLRRDLESRELECNGYIQEIEKLTQER